MNYISQINAFEDWLECNYLTPTEELLWYKLMSLNNRFGWSEWFFVTNPALMARVSIKSEKTLILARNNLKQAGLIDFISGKKGQPTKYKISNLYENTVKITVNNTVKATVFPTVKATVYSTDKEDLELEEDKEEESRVKQKSVYSLYENNFGIIPGSIYNLLTDVADTYSYEWIEAAFTEAAKAGAKSFNYIDACLKDWRDNGFKNGKKGGKQRGSTLKLAEPVHGPSSAGPTKPSRARSSSGVAPTMP